VSMVRDLWWKGFTKKVSFTFTFYSEAVVPDTLINAKMEEK